MLLCKNQITKQNNYNKYPIGKGLLNSAINSLPVELHIPGYNYCGPGTKLAERLARQDAVVNPLDEACKIQNIAYDQDRSIEKPNEADKVLLKTALDRVRSPNSSIGEKTAALGVPATMKVKSKFGMGCIPLKTLIKHAGGALKGVSFLIQTKP